MKAEDWRIDTSAGSPILVYKNCSVIQDEDASYVLALIQAAKAKRVEYWAAVADEGEIVHSQIVDPDHGIDDDTARSMINQFINDVACAEGNPVPVVLHLRKMSMEATP